LSLLKECSTCGVTKPLTDFYRDSTRSDGRTYICQPCIRARARNWREKNIEKYTATERTRWLRRKYGLSLEEYDVLFKSQGGVCAICGQPPNGKALAVDHCHESGAVRGLLHDGCNIALGFIEKAGLEAVADYLRSQHVLPLVRP
jgi:hypothetical protein